MSHSQNHTESFPPARFWLLAASKMANVLTESEMKEWSQLISDYPAWHETVMVILSSSGNSKVKDEPAALAAFERLQANQGNGPS